VKIAVTGSTGFIGSYVVGKLLSEEYELFLYTRNAAALLAKYGQNQNIEIIETDYSFESLKLEFNIYDAVIHLAGVRYEKNKKNFSDYYINVEISENLFKVCELYGVGNVVFASSIGVYSNNTDVPCVEDSYTSPTNPYALSKLVIENLGCLYKVNLKSMRIAQIIGVDEREGYMIRTFIDNALKGKKLTVYGEGKGSRDYLYINDVVDALVNACYYTDVSGVFNVGSGVKLSHHSLAKKVAKYISNDESDVVLDKSMDSDSSEVFMSIDKVNDILHWRPSYTIDAALQDIRKKFDSDLEF